MKHPNAARVGRKKGFTLMEMLIVIAIIAVLVAIAIPTISAATEKAARAVDMANARALQAMLAAMILQGDIEFPDARVAPSEAEIGVWILVCKDTASYPMNYTSGKDSTYFCGADTGISFGGTVSDVWNNQIAGLPLGRRQLSWRRERGQVAQQCKARSRRCERLGLVYR